MNQFMLRQHLSQVEKHIRQGGQHLAQQHRIIASLCQAGRDPAMAFAC